MVNIARFQTTWRDYFLTFQVLAVFFTAIFSYSIVNKYYLIALVCILVVMFSLTFYYSAPGSFEFNDKEIIIKSKTKTRIISYIDISSISIKEIMPHYRSIPVSTIILLAMPELKKYKIKLIINNDIPVNLNFYGKNLDEVKTIFNSKTCNSVKVEIPTIDVT